MNQRENVADENRLLRFLIGACSERFSRMGLSRSTVLRRGNFFISKSWKGSSCGLKRFWAISLISRVERAGQPFSVVAAWRPFKRAKPAAWDPPPRFPIWACFERFSPEDILRFWISRTRSGSVFLDRRDYGEFIAVDDGLLLIFSQESHRGC